jgi:hypothetical protein
LESLLRLRRAGRVPSGPVTVIVGKLPAWVADAPNRVVIDRDPAQLDLRVLVGLEVHLIDIQTDTELLFKAMAATEEVGALPVGACTAEGACGLSEGHERAMRRYREGLCQTL